MFISTHNIHTNTNYSGTLTTTNLCIDGVTSSSHIMKYLAMHQVHFITYARFVDLNVCTYCDFVLPVSIINIGGQS